MHPSPQYLGEVVLSDMCESTNRVKKSVIKELYSEIGCFHVKKGSYMTFDRAKIGKIFKTWSMTKKRSSEMLGVKMD